MKIDVLFALPGPENAVKGEKLLIVAAATEHEDPRYLESVIADVAETGVQVGAYSRVHKVTLELDEALVLAMLKAGVVRAQSMSAPAAKVDRARLH